MIIYGKTEDETVKLTAKVLGLSEIDVRFMLAIERGEKTGDVIEIDEIDNINKSINEGG